MVALELRKRARATSYISPTPDGVIRGLEWLGRTLISEKSCLRWLDGEGGGLLGGRMGLEVVKIGVVVGEGGG